MVGGLRGGWLMQQGGTSKVHWIRGNFHWADAAAAKCVRSPRKSHHFPSIFILMRLVFQNVSIAPTIPRARLFDNLAVRNAMQKKLRGTQPAWRRRLASKAPGNAGDHLQSCPQRFQHFPDGLRGCVNANGN
eukprot:78796-Chlamydomonas_euryale.AAC.1